MAALYRITFDSGWYLMGRELESFEHKYSEFCGTKYALGVASGLDALRLIFKAYLELGDIDNTMDSFRAVLSREAEFSRSTG